MAVPVVASRTENTALNTTTLTLTKASGVSAGDLLLLICGSDTGTTNGFDDPPADWNLLNYANGGGSLAVSCAVFWRIADGGEAATVDVVQGTNGDLWGWYVRVTGADTTTPIHVTGTDYGSGTASPNHAIPGVTTTVPDCLAFGVAGMGGTPTVSYQGTGWTKTDDVATGGATPSQGTFGTKSMAAAGATTSFIIDFGEDDVAVAGFTFAVVAPSVIITPASADTTLTAVAPTVSIALVVEPAFAGVSLTAIAPTVVLGSLAITPDPAVASLTAVAPSVLVVIVVAPDPAAFSLTAIAPTVAVVSLVTPASAGLALTAIAPTVTIVGPRAEVSLLCDLTISVLAEVAMRADLDVEALTGYRVIARNVEDGTETVLGFGTSLTGVAIADGRYMLRVEADGAYWRKARFAREWPLTIVDGEIEQPLPEIRNLTYSIVGETVYLSWTWELQDGTATPTTFGVWTGSSEPVSTAGAPAQSITAVAPGGYSTTLPGPGSTLYVAVAARLGSEVGPVATLTIVAVETVDSPSGQSARIPDGEWASQEP